MKAGDSAICKSVGAKAKSGLTQVVADRGFAPQGRVAYGTLQNPSAWLEIENIVASG